MKSNNFENFLVSSLLESGTSSKNSYLHILFFGGIELPDESKVRENEELSFFGSNTSLSISDVIESLEDLGATLLRTESGYGALNSANSWRDGLGINIIASNTSWNSVHVADGIPTFALMFFSVYNLYTVDIAIRTAILASVGDINSNRDIMLKDINLSNVTNIVIPDLLFSPSLT